MILALLCTYSKHQTCIKLCLGNCGRGKRKILEALSPRFHNSPDFYPVIHKLFSNNLKVALTLQHFCQNYHSWKDGEVQTVTLGSTTLYLFCSWSNNNWRKRHLAVVQSYWNTNTSCSMAPQWI